MRIKSVRIENLRSFVDQTIELGRYTCLVGANGSGKSTLLCALNIFFRDDAASALDLEDLQEEDFHSRDTARPIVITVTFSDLSETAADDFADYVRQGELVVSAEAEFDPDRHQAPVKQYGKRRGIRDFAKYFEADKAKAKAAELKAIYSDLRAKHRELRVASTKDAMRTALREYEDSHPDVTELLASEDQFYGFSHGANRLAKHVQWVFVPAAKDASEERTEAKDSSLGKLLARTVRARTNFDQKLEQIRGQAQREYASMLEGEREILGGLSTSIQSRLAEWAHPGARIALQWQNDSAKAIRIEEPLAEIVAGEGQFIGDLARLGHGFQRSYLLALLQELSVSLAESQPTLILGVEEPELYQHPPQCRHMSNVLRTLATANSQVVFATHSPYFVSGAEFDSVRLFRKSSTNWQTVVSHASTEAVATMIGAARGDSRPATREGAAAKIQQSLQPSISEIFFAPRVVLVEGREDIAYLLTYLNLLGRADVLRRSGCHIVSTDKKSLLLTPRAVLAALSVPTLLVFDGDTNIPDKSGVREMHRLDNLALLRISGVPDPNPWPIHTLWTSTTVMWRTEMRQEVEADFDPTAWNAIKERVRIEFGQVGDLHKNPQFVADTLETAWKRGLRSQTLQRLCDELVAFCSKD
jgi:putative ATP-dependent endonuclease of OLD family